MLGSILGRFGARKDGGEISMKPRDLNYKDFSDLKHEDVVTFQGFHVAYKVFRVLVLGQRTLG